MSSIKCFDLSPQVHTVQAISGSNFFPLREEALHILLPVSQWKQRAEPEPFAPNRFVPSGLALVWSTAVLARSRVAGVAYQRTYMHQLILPKLVKVTLGGIFLKEFCYISDNHGSIWANFCSPSKTTKLVQISIGLPERASTEFSYWKNQLSTWTLTNF